MPDTRFPHAPTDGYAEFGYILDDLTKLGAVPHIQMSEKLTPEEIESIAQKMAEIILQRTSSHTQVEAIEPNAIYTTPDAARVLKVRPSTIQTNVRRGLTLRTRAASGVV